MGLDFGDKTVGVAVCDELRQLASGVEIIRRDKPAKLRRTLARIGQLSDEYEIKGLVIGLPLLLDGREGERCEKSRAFGQRLSERLGLPVVYQDERLSTEEAYERMAEIGIAPEQRHDLVDEVAAVIILQDYLDNPKNFN